MKNLSISLIYLGFFALIGTATYITNNGNCLWALLLTPSLTYKQQMADQSFSIIGDIITATAGQSEAAQRKAFNIAKAASIAQAIVNTYLAANAALAMDPLKEVFPGQRFVQAALTIASGLANVAKIRSTQFQGGGGGNSAPSPAAGNATMTPPPTFTSPQTTNLGTGDLSSGQGQQNQPMRAYVVERDIQQTTSRVRRLSLPSPSL